MYKFVRPYRILVLGADNAQLEDKPMRQSMSGTDAVIEAYDILESHPGARALVIDANDCLLQECKCGS